MAEEGYSRCRCRDCMEIAISNDIAHPDFCWECEEAGCTGEGDCCREDAYGEAEA